ncbi:hypothetical protein ET495_07515 [Xylanimonas allomyrinae]|uniref:DUF916 domain-containing protein n=1 Tax=Xylanimonas allomyrinae TaxID=2509459 RepID=A0A4P6EYH9_9MICO|nr:hypothetical protein [Xylanimonas allomyrinae]QAY63118.1 hypothetical protein ET495_07515 [Xylanimonas allomyrinae]
MPADAEPGDHAGGILAVSVVEQDDGPSVGYAAGTRLYVRVAGTVAPAVDVDRLGGAYRGRIGPVSPGALDVEATLVNSGNVRLDPRTVVHVRSLFGLWTATVPLHDVGEVLPGGATTTSGTLDRVPPLGPLWLTLEAPDVTSRGQDLTAATAVTGPATLVWAVPWTLLATLVLLAAAAGLAVRNLRRRVPGTGTSGATSTIHDSPGTPRRSESRPHITGVTVSPDPGAGGERPTERGAP